MPPVLLVYTSIRYRLPRFSPKTILYHDAVKIQLPPPGGDGATRRVADPWWEAFFCLEKRKLPTPRKKFALVLNQPNYAVICVSAYRQWELSQRVFVHRRPRRRGFHIPRFRTSPKARSLHRSSSLPEKRTSLAGTKSLRVPLTGGEYNLAVPRKRFVGGGVLDVPCVECAAT